MIGVRVAQPDAANRQGRHPLQPKAQALGQLPALPETALRQFASNASIAGMATLTIRQLDEKTKTRLRVRAAHHGRSMEEEAREILRSAVSASPAAEGNLAAAVQRRFAALGGIDLELPRRDSLRRPPRFPK